MAQRPTPRPHGAADRTAPQPTPAAPQPTPAPPGAPVGDALSEALREVLTLTQLARAALAERLGMPLTNVEAVEHVVMARAADEPIGPVELSRRLGVTSAAGTQSVNRLVSEGHLVRHPHPNDRRRQILDATDSGLGHVMGELAPLLTLLHEAGQALDEAERAAAKHYLDNVATAYRSYLAGPGA